MNPLASRTVRVDGIRQVYRVAGQGPVCLVHSGGPGVHPGYLRIPALEPHLTMVYLDPVGSGDSDALPDGDYSMSRYAEFSRRVLDHLGVDRALFLGHSHGGFVALQFGLDHPDRLDGLILYDTAPTKNAELTEIATKEMADFARRWPDRPEAVEANRVWQEVVVDGTRTVDDDESHTDYLKAILPAYFADYRATAADAGDLALGVRHDPNRKPTDWDVRARLGEIHVPTLVIVGSRDFICPPLWSYQLNTGLPDARLCELTASGHFGHIEQPGEFAAAVLEFAHRPEGGA